MNIRTLFFLIVTIKRMSLQQIRYSLRDSTSQSKTISEKYSNLAIDGDINSCAITESKENELAWWSVKLDKDYNVERIIINYNAGSDYYKYMNYLKIFVSKNVANLEENVCVSYKGKKDKAPRFIILNCDKPVAGNLVTIKRFGGLFRNWLVLCEVVILADIEIISFNKPTSQNGIIFKNTSGLAVDGNNDSCAKIIAKKGEFAWWRVFLGEDYYIDKVVIYFNPNSSDVYTLNYFIIYVSNEDHNFQKDACEGFNITTQQTKFSGVIELKCREPKPRGKYVTIKKIGGNIPHHLQGLCEIEVHSKQFICKTDEIRCEELETCLPPENRCDKVRQCPDGRDEISCTCENYQYGCKFGHCIPSNWLCDNIIDCPLEDDEIYACANCTKDKFRCDAGKVCIFINQRCDGIYDCYDHSDEENCFYFKDFFLKAIYKGDPDFYVCSVTWGNFYSEELCYRFFYSTVVSTEYDKINDRKINSIIKMQRKGFSDYEPAISAFLQSFSCPGRLYVKIYCKEENNPRNMCGIRGLPDNATGPYIINGDLAKPGAWPWHVQILVDGFYICGGSLLRQNWVLTAAHCLTVVNSASRVTIKVGTNIYNDPLAPEISAIRIVTHPEYDNSTRNHDIGLIKLATLLKITDLVKPICLPYLKWDSGKKFFRYCVLSGFGEIDRSKNSPKYLLQGRMNIMTIDECARNLEKTGTQFVLIYKNELKTRPIFCAGSYPSTHGINSCKGDSGSPLVCKDKLTGIWYQYGVVSYSEDGGYLKTCTNSVFSKVYEHRNFIYDEMTLR